MIATLVLTLRIAMAISLFTFLGWALLILWRDLRQQAGILAASKTPTINLEVLNERDGLIQNRSSLSAIIIGRDKDCDLALTDERISAHHAHILFHHGQWWLEDLRSTNGTFLNKEKINIPTVLTSGDEFQCGDTLFRVRVGFNGHPPSGQQLKSGEQSWANR